MSATDPFALAGLTLLGLGTLALVILWATVGLDRLATWWEGVRERRQLARLEAARCWDGLHGVDTLDWGLLDNPPYDETPDLSRGRGPVSVEAPGTALRLHSTPEERTRQDGH